MITVCRVKTPIGLMSALYKDAVAQRVFFPDEQLPAGVVFDDTLLFAQQITEYFNGRRKQFDLPVFIPGTQFRQDIYRATLMIPYGETASYADVAFAAGYPRAMRAAGSAMKATPLPIIIPCHRVVHKDYRKKAYRGGLDIKQYLLDLEQRYK